MPNVAWKKLLSITYELQTLTDLLLQTVQNEKAVPLQYSL